MADPLQSVGYHHEIPDAIPITAAIPPELYNISFSSLSKAEQNDVVALLFVSPSLEPPAFIPGTAEDFRAVNNLIEEGRIPAFSLANQSHEIVMNMWDGYLEQIKVNAELSAQRREQQDIAGLTIQAAARDSLMAPDAIRANPAQSIQSLDQMEQNRTNAQQAMANVWSAGKETESMGAEQAAGLLVAAFSIVIMGVAEVGIVNPANQTMMGTLPVQEVIQQLPAALIPADMSLQLSMLGALMVAVPIRAGIGNAIEGAINKGTLPQDRKMALSFAREMKASVSNAAFEALVINLVVQNRPELAKDPAALQTEVGRLMARIRTVVLTIAAALAFKVNFGGMTGTEIRALIEHQDIDSAENVPEEIKDLIKLIQGQKALLPENEWNSLIDSLVTWLNPDPETGQGPAIETLIESGRAVARNMTDRPIDQSSKQRA